MASASVTRMTPNGLVDEKSPYLQQHAHNPVHWHPWGERAFGKAREEDKPILLSVGYATCHWCHVMEAESFSDPRTAALMNRAFVNIKVDREERPDIDHIYMTALSVISGSGGWPLNVFLTPDGRPFFGGTYFPPASRFGMPAWTDLLEKIAAVWGDPDHRRRLLASATEVTDALAALLTTPRAPAGFDPKALFHAARKVYASRFDARRGGFGKAPKFPSPPILDFLLTDHALTGRAGKADGASPDSLEMVLKTLHAMAAGGIHDHVGGGFHRYATDSQWHLPHFEKMLYDNAQLIGSYTEAYRLTGDDGLLETARAAADYVLREMSHARGGFFSAEDADSLPKSGGRRKVEGAFYVWTRDEVRAALDSEEAALFLYRYGVRADGNVASDPHGEFTGKNVLFAAHSLKGTAEKFRLAPEEVRRRLSSATGKIAAVRRRRPRPFLDDKVLASWNGLMIASLARLYQTAGATRYLEAARGAAMFIKNRLYDADSGRLYRRWRDGERKVAGLADDYAFMAQALIELYISDFDPDWLEWALALTEEQLAAFFDPESGGFYMTRADHDENLILRTWDDTDNVLPSAASVTAWNLVRLGRITGKKTHGRTAGIIMGGAAAGIEKYPVSASRMLVSMGLAGADPIMVAIASGDDADGAKRLADAARSSVPLGGIVVPAGAAPPPKGDTAPWFSDPSLIPVGGRAAAYVGIGERRQGPLTDAAALKRLLDSLGRPHAPNGTHDD